MGSKTSRVLPFEASNSPIEDLVQIDLSSLPKNIELQGEDVLVQGPVTWQELREFLFDHQLDCQVWPTDTSAQVLAGVATSCTGERSFRFGPMRNQVQRIEVMNWQGEVESIEKSDELDFENKSEFLRELAPFANFKNPPFPVLKKKIDLHIGSEGQLGIILRALIKTTPRVHLKTIGLGLNSWLEHDNLAQAVFAIQELRSRVTTCEFFDQQCLKFVQSDHGLDQTKDYLFFQVDSHEDIILLSEKLDFIDEEDLFEIEESRYQKIRLEIPRYISEDIQRKGSLKKGTDAQVDPESFQSLLESYRKMAKQGIDFVLFGHAGDRHLHFNFLPEKDQQKTCDELLLKFYDEIENLNVSPFAEHGIGILKKPFIEKFYPPILASVFAELKSTHDPHGQFFPQGFMSWKGEQA